MQEHRIIRFQFKRNGLIHRAEVLDQVIDNTLHVSPPYRTLCGKNIPIGQGGWGFGRDDLCAECHRILAERRTEDLPLLAHIERTAND